MAPAPWQGLQLAVLALLSVPRLGVLTAAELLAAAVCVMAAAGAGPDTLSPWRRRLVASVVPVCTRVALACAGFWRIRVRGAALDPRCRVVVCNHRHLLDGFVLNWLLRAPAFVARASMQRLPMFGSILKAQQCIFVDKEDAPSRQRAGKAIRSRCAQQEAPPLVIFPEGSINYGPDGELLPFKSGAFRPGLPVQPVLLRYGGACAGQEVQEARPESVYMYIIDR